MTFTDEFKNNTEEIIFGFIYGILFSFYLGFFGIPIALLCSFFWRLGGMKGHAIRVFGVPIVAYGALYFTNHHWTCAISGILTALVLSIGYGIPDQEELTTIPTVIRIYDKGSALGKFWYNISKTYANILTRGTIIILLAISFIPSLF